MLSRVWLFGTPWTAVRQASLSITNSQSLLKLMSIESVMSSNHRILCRPLLLLPSIFPSIRVFSNESVLRIKWPKYWSFSFSISPSNEYSLLKFIIHIFISETDICCWRNDSNSTFFYRATIRCFMDQKEYFLEEEIVKSFRISLLLKMFFKSYR